MAGRKCLCFGSPTVSAPGDFWGRGRAARWLPAATVGFPDRCRSQGNHSQETTNVSGESHAVARSSADARAMGPGKGPETSSSDVGDVSPGVALLGTGTRLDRGPRHPQHPGAGVRDAPGPCTTSPVPFPQNHLLSPAPSALGKVTGEI